MLLSQIPRKDLAPSFVSFNFDKDCNVAHKSLGMKWVPNEDVIVFSIDLEVREFTRRGILSTYSQIFDLTGIIQPFLITPKSLIRSLCNLKLGWDEEIFCDYVKIWQNWLSFMNELEPVRVNRCLIPDLNFVSLEINAFSDASSEVYASVVYLRVVYKSYVSVNFVVGKRKIAPYKETLTVPKLELIAASLSVRLVQTAFKELCLKDCNVFYWVDAMVVLHLVASEDKRFKIFVANRLALIRQYSLPSQWQFCPTALNAANVGTRSSGMAHLPTWINGPSFLSRLELEHFAQPGCRKSEVVLAAFVSEVREPLLLALVNHYSDLHRLLRAVAIIHRLRKLLQIKAYQYRIQQGLSTEKDKSFNPQVGSGVITAVELKNAERDICRVVQSLEFDYLVKYLTDGGVGRVVGASGSEAGFAGSMLN